MNNMKQFINEIKDKIKDNIIINYINYNIYNENE